MLILVLNCGSSSLKFELARLREACPTQRLARGSVTSLGDQAVIRALTADDREWQATQAIPDHAAATGWVLQWLADSGTLPQAAPDAIGHRVVHGGPDLAEPVRIDHGVLAQIEAAGELAPLHNRAALAAIAGARAATGDAVPMVAVFDTAFHRDLPPHAARYAIAPDVADRLGIRRYGFHGLAHRWMAQRCPQLMHAAPAEVRLITLHLGSGASAAAIAGGRSVDTSMGFTPLEGLVMGTRCGDVDPAIVRYLCDRQGKSPGEVEHWLNHQCGLRGVSGASADVRELLRLEAEGHPGAKQALALFCYRVRKYIGAYVAVLGGVDAIAFGGGIGEHSAEIRRRVCQDMQWCGLELDASLNTGTVGHEGRISSADSRTQAFVVPVQEERLMAQDTFFCLRQNPKERS